MATVTALQSFVGRLSKDVVEPAHTKKNAAGKDVLVPEVVTKQGESVRVHQGQLFDSAHPAVKAFPSMFGAVETLHPVEQATAAPGEQRVGGRFAKKS